MLSVHWVCCDWRELAYTMRERVFEEDEDQLIDIYDVKVPVVLFWPILSRTMNRTLITHFIFPYNESSNYIGNFFFIRYVLLKLVCSVSNQLCHF